MDAKFQPLLQLVESASSAEVVERLRVLKQEERALRALLRVLTARERLADKLARPPAAEVARAS